MNITEKHLKIITQVLLLAVLAIVPFLKIDELYFPFISGKAYVFRALVAVAVFFWVWLMLQGKAYRPKLKNILVVALGLFFLGQVLAALFGVDPLYSFFSGIERADGVFQYGFWVAYFLMLVSVFKKKHDWKIFFSTFVIVALLLSVYSWFNFSPPVDFAPEDFNVKVSTQLFGLFGNPAYFAAFLLFAIGFSLILFERKFFASRWIHYALLAATGFFTFTLIFTQIRGVYIGLAGGVLLFCILTLLFLRKEYKRLAYACGLVLLIGAVSLPALFVVRDTEFVRQTYLLARVTEVVKFWEVGSVRERVLNWNIALKAFQERPVFGYGPENFGAAANKYYDYRIGRTEPWFDRAHNQPLDTLATSGIIGFSAYLFWLGAAGFLIFKIAKEKKVLGFLLAGIFLAYFLQGLFLFDLLAIYLGLFPLLAFLIYQSYELRIDTNVRMHEEQKNQKRIERKLWGIAPKNLPILGLAGAVVAFVLYTSVFVPWKANAAALQFFQLTQSNVSVDTKPYLEKAFAIESFYTSWEVRKMAGWQFMNTLAYNVDENTEPAKIRELQDLYDLITVELERTLEARPTNPQIYHVLATTYRLGFEKLGRNDLDKAEAVLQKAFQQSDLRLEYQNEFVRVLVLQGRFQEAEQTAKDYVARAPFYDYFPYITLGNLYFVGEKYEQALEQYDKAQEAGYVIYSSALEYARYLTAAEQLKEYEKIIDLAKARLASVGPDADTYFNIAVAYFQLGEREAGREYILRAIELNPKYEEYRAFFE